MIDKEKCFDAAVALTVAAIRANSVEQYKKTSVENIGTFLVEMYIAVSYIV